MPLPMYPKPGPAAPASPPTGNPGTTATAMAKVRQAIQILEQTLPELPIGSKEHEACVEAVRKLSKAYPATDEVPGLEMTTLAGMMRQAKQGQMMRQLTAMGGQGGGGGGAPGSSPQMQPGPMAGAM